ncbi:MAG: methionyl-tRNA formyltransferase [Alphaproteobacteria bacterium]|nr:methionyl-tRNA formyltransferase [Alphaproteobacteria bacterium]
MHDRLLEEHHQQFSITLLGDKWLRDKVFNACADMVTVKTVIGGNKSLDAVPICDLLVLAHCARFIPDDIRNRARLGAIAYHPSLLPRHRGRSAVEWTIRMRDPIAGGSVFWLNDKADGGAIQSQDWCFVANDDTPQSLWRRELSPMGVRLLTESIRQIMAGNIIRQEQCEAFATFEPAIIKHQSLSDKG